MVTIIAYVNIGPIPSAVPNTCLKIACIAPFHARAATKPNAAVIKAAIFSITSPFIIAPPHKVN